MYVVRGENPMNELFTTALIAVFSIGVIFLAVPTIAVILYIWSKAIGAGLTMGRKRAESQNGSESPQQEGDRKWQRGKTEKRENAE